MENSTQILVFWLTMYFPIGRFMYLYFILAMLLYISVIFANSVLIVTIYMSRNLHEPMYLFLCSLFVNEMYGTTSLMPCWMVQILSGTHYISTFNCLIQTFNIHTYIVVEFGMLTIMAYDRYVCICKPLHYTAIITKRKVKMVILLIWTVPFVEVGVLMPLTINLKLCGTVIYKLDHDNLAVELFCSTDRMMSYIYDMVFGLIFTVALPLSFISLTYIKILTVCLKGSKETKWKAFDTCSPHLISLMSFVFACLYNMISQRFDMTFVPFELRFILSTYGLIVQPLLNPVIYGLKLSKIRHTLKKFIILKKG